MPRTKQNAESTSAANLPAIAARHAAGTDESTPTKDPGRRRRKLRPKKRKQREEARRAMDEETRRVNKELSKRYKLVRLSAKDAGYNGPYVKLDQTTLDQPTASASAPNSVFVDSLLEHIVENKLDPTLKSKRSIRTISKLKTQQRGRSHCLPKSSIVKQMLERSATTNTTVDSNGMNAEVNAPCCAFCQCERDASAAPVHITGPLLGPYLLQDHRLTQFTTSSTPFEPTTTLQPSSDALIVKALTDEILVCGEPKDIFVGETVYFHDHCLRYCDSVYMVGYHIPQLHALLKFARRMRCSHCDRLGANLVCFRRGSHNRNRRCSKAYHYACALQSKCYLSIATYQLGCNLHADDLRLHVGKNPSATSADEGGLVLDRNNASSKLSSMPTACRFLHATSSSKFPVPSAGEIEKFGYENLNVFPN